MPGNRGEGYFAVSLSSCWKPETDMGDDILSPYWMSGCLSLSIQSGIASVHTAPAIEK